MTKATKLVKISMRYPGVEDLERKIKDLSAQNAGIATINKYKSKLKTLLEREKHELYAKHGKKWHYNILNKSTDTYSNINTDKLKAGLIERAKKAIHSPMSNATQLKLWKAVKYLSIGGLAGISYYEKEKEKEKEEGAEKEKEEGAEKGKQKGKQNPT
jgi:hypothetical protein